MNLRNLWITFEHANQRNELDDGGGISPARRPRSAATGLHGATRVLSLSTDSILAERLAVEAAEPLGVPVFPVLAYGITPYFRAFPGTITLRVETYMSVVGDILDAIAEHGFKRILIVNGHGGNTPAQGFVGEWIADHPGMRIKFHNWWNAPESLGASAGNRSRRFPCVVDGKFSVDTPNENQGAFRAEADERPGKLRRLDPKSVREYLNDGNYGGLYQRDDEEMMKIWQAGVKETRALLMEHGIRLIGGSASPEDDDS